MLHLLLILSAFSTSFPGVPFEINLNLPNGYTCTETLSDSLFEVIPEENGTFTIIPLGFSDSLPLPDFFTTLNEDGDTLRIYLSEQPIVVTGWFPDSIMVPSLPPFPGFISIPPGLPEDYARNLSFWLVWGKPPGFPWLWVIGGIFVLAALAFFIVKRIKRKNIPESVPGIGAPAGKVAENEALALLESENFLHGHWPELYSEVDALFRTTIAGKFGIINKALTLTQISRSLASTGKGRKFLEQASPLIKETTLQRYADWGSSQERAAGYIRRLAKLRREWS